MLLGLLQLQRGSDAEAADSEGVASTATGKGLGNGVVVQRALHLRCHPNDIHSHTRTDLRPGENGIGDQSWDCHGNYRFWWAGGTSDWRNRR